MDLIWNRCGNTPQWCNLLTLDLQHAHFNNMQGVYIIWHGGQTPWTVYVGQGNIAERLSQHRRDARILRYSPFGLFVTWASVPNAAQRDGVERFLANRLSPREGDAHPQAVPIAVNLPW
jgi:hypothetical protein